MKKQSNFCLIVGISSYQYIRSLPSSVTNDANSIHDLLTSCEMGFPSENVMQLVDDGATGEAIRHKLEVIAEHSTYESTVLIYFLGHGTQLVSGSNAGVYLLPVDVRYRSDEELAQTSISGENFGEVLREICARRVVIFFDCCHSGGIGEAKQLYGKELQSGLPEYYYQQLTKDSGRVIISSSRSDEVSWVSPGEKNGLFTKHLLDGFQGKAIKTGNTIRVMDLFDYIQQKVTEERSNQHPFFIAELRENYPIALLPSHNVLAPDLNTPDDGFNYDVFISYRHVPADRAWVKKKLVPALRASELNVCLDDSCFRLGRPIMMEMERAVLESRYTLAVFSPDYNDSGFTELENIMAQHLGLETQKVRFIGLIYRECKTELRFRASLMLDMREKDEFDENVKRIVYECLNS